MGATVGFIGLGNMGGRIAKRLAAAGHQVLGYDVRPDLAGSLGLTAVASPAEACAAPVVMMSLPNSAIVEQVVLGDQGIAQGAKAGTIVVDLTTADPASTKKLAAILNEHGVTLIDAAVSGGPLVAEQGALTIMAGGPVEALEQVRPLLDAFAKRIFHLGETGNGHVAKIVNNFLNGINLAATAEAMVAGKKAGLDPKVLLEVINHSSGKNWATENRFPRILNGDYIEGGLDHFLMAKDIDLYNKLTKSVETPNILGHSVASVFELAIGMGRGGQVSNRIVDVLGDLAGGVRVSEPN